MNDAPDLDLLRVFAVLFRERHLTRAAGVLGKSQPSVSRALSRMRELFADPLFVRTPRGMVPTPRAEALAPEVEALLERARALVAPARVDPATLRRTFTIATSDFAELHLAEALVHELAAQAPGVDVTFRPIPPGAHGQPDDVDLVVGVQGALPQDAMSQFLFDDTFLCAARRGHPRVKRRLTLERFVELSHIQIAPRGTPGGPVDDALAALGLSRRVAVRTYSFLTAPLLVARTDLLLTAPSRVLLPMARKFGLATFKLPFELRGFKVHQAWHPRAQQDPVHRWFRGVVMKAAQSRKAREAQGGAATSRGLPTAG